MTAPQTQPADPAAITIHLGGKPYTISPPPYNMAKAWRASLGPVTDQIVGALRQAQQLPFADWKAANIQDVIGLVTQVVPTLVNAPDTIHDLLIAYSPELQQDQAFIDSTAHDPEIMAAFIQVVGQAYPFGQLMTYIGQGRATTSTNSPTPRGRTRPVPAS